MEKSSSIYVAGHTGLVGSSIVRLLKKNGFTNLLLKSSSELDLRNSNQVDSFFKKKIRSIMSFWQLLRWGVY